MRKRRMLPLLLTCLTVCLLVCLSARALAVEGLPPTSVPVIHGLDVSAWQREVDWHQVSASGVEIAMLRASEGSSVVDARFEANWTGAKAAGLSVGFYHFLTAATVPEAEAQADFFLSVIGDRVPDCLLAVDVGSASSLPDETLTEVTLAFLRRVETRSGYRAMLYTDAWAARARFGSALAAYPIWVADYGVSEPEENGKWDAWVGFQYGDRGDIPGITGRVDLDYFTREIYQSAAPTPAPTPCPSPTPMPVTERELLCLLLPEDMTVPALSGLLGVHEDTLRTLNILPGGTALAGQLIRYPGPSAATGAFAGLHVLQPFEDIATIARRYGVTPASLRVLNGLQGEPSRLGQVLKVPALGDHEATVPAWVTERAVMARRGDTLSALAARFGMTADTLSTINGLTPDAPLYAGQVLRLTPFGSGSTGGFRGGYVVQRGDTLDSIARRFGVSESRLFCLNNIARRNLIFPGMLLLIPSR